MIPTLVAAAFQRVFIDEILVQGRIDWLKPLLIAMGITALVRLAAVALQQVYLTKLEIRLALTESVRFLQHVLRLPVTFFQYRFAGDIVGRVVSTARVARLISGELATTAVSLLTLVFFVAAMLPFDPLLTVVGVAIGSLNLVALRWFSRWRIDQNRAIEQIRGRLAGGVMWAIQIIESVKATGAESDLMVRWTGDQARVVSAEQQLGVYDTILLVLPPFLATLTTIVVLGLGGRQVAMGSLSIGSLVAFQTLLASFNQPFLDLSRLGSQVQELQGRPRSDRRRPAPRDRPGARGPAGLARRHGYPEAARRAAAVPPALRPPRASRRDVRLQPDGRGTADQGLLPGGPPRPADRPGRRIGERQDHARPPHHRALPAVERLRSSTTASPSTQIPREIFVNSVALVDERIAMFQGTVRDNLTLWDELVSSDRLIQAGLGAAIHRDLLQRRGGYDAAVAEGARNFSGGQRQRLEIARALVRDPSLLVLDEATSALDPKTEAIVDDHLRRRGCACLIAAHRLSTIRDCDEIIVLAAGRVVQRGTHDELIARSPGAVCPARLPTRNCPPSAATGWRPTAGRRPSRPRPASRPRGARRAGSLARTPHRGRVGRRRAAIRPPRADDDRPPAAIPHRGAVALQHARGDGRQPPPAAR